MGRIGEEMEERHVPCFFCFLLVAALCSLLVQPAQAEPVDSLAVEAEHQATMQKKTEAKEITIYILGKHKAAAALLDAADEGTSVTGIADFDSLSSTYGLMGIYRKGRRSSGFYGHRFRLTFPPVADVATVARAYWNLSYVKSVEPKPPRQEPDKRVFKAAEVDSFRIGNKLMAGLGGGIAGAFLGAFIMADLYQAKDGDDILGGLGAFMKGLEVGYIVGTATGVSWVDSQDHFLITLAGSVLGLGVPVGAIDVISAKTGWELETLAGVSAFLGPIIGATIASERGRKPLAAKLHLKPEARRVSVGLLPNPKGGLSAVATLRF